MEPMNLGPMARVTEGMRVLDASGAHVGTVSDFKIGDPGAVTADGQRMDTGTGGIIGAVLGPEPRVPELQAEHLLRTGYLKIDRSGLFTGSMYVPADDIAEVTDDEVRLVVVVE